MKSFQGSNTSLVNTFTTLSLNTSTANTTLGKMLINEQAKLLYLKFFDNERAVTMVTIGPKSLTLTGTLASGAVSATLTSAWTDITCKQLVVFSSGEQRTVQFIQNSTSITWTSALTATTTTAISAVGVQSYPLPANVSKVKNSTITIGQLVYTPAPVQTIQEWSKLNALPYTSSLPAYFFIYNNELQFWPIPSSSGNIITLNCQINVADMTYSDYTTGTLAASGMVVGSNAVIGSGTSWNTTFPTGVDLTHANLFLIATPPNGDGIPYQIQSFSSGTSATLLKPVVNAPNISGSSYTIGQYPLLSQDFHDVIVYGALRIYFSSIVKDTEKFNLYNNLYNEKLELMKFYLSNKQVNVDLSVTPIITNPNLYQQSIG